MATAAPHDASCPGCLGENRCWVCLGNGTIENPGGSRSVCVRCAGTGRCTETPRATTASFGRASA